MQNKTKIKIFVGIISAIIIVILANYVLSEVIAIQRNGKNTVSAPHATRSPMSQRTYTAREVSALVARRVWDPGSSTRPVS